MEIHIRLAGVELGPYSANQLRDYLTEGLVSNNDLVKESGTDNWITVEEMLAKLPPEPEGEGNLRTAPMPANIETPAAPTIALSEMATDADEVSEEPRRAPDAPPGVSHLPMRAQEAIEDPGPPTVETQTKRKLMIGPSAPAAASSSGKVASSIMTTTPLTPTRQATKSVSRANPISTLSQNTSPLPTKLIPAPPVASAPSAPPAGSGPAAPQPDLKRAPFPSKLRSLTAKTVPMRSTPPNPPTPPAAPAPLPVTAPLRTKTILQSNPDFSPQETPAPKPPPKPPPSIVAASTKKFGRSTEVAAPVPEPTPAPLEELVDTTKLARPVSLAPDRSKFEKQPEPEDQLEPLEEPTIPPPSKRRPLSLIYAAAAVVAGLLVYYVWSPYHSASTLRDALTAGDATALGMSVDFDSVRASLKQQIEDQIPQGAAKDSATADAVAMMNRSIDQYVTPTGISALVNKSDQKVDLAQVISPDVAANIVLAFNKQPVRNEGLSSINDFVMAMDATMLHLKVAGLNWKLNRVELRPDLKASGSTGSVSPLLSPVIDTYLEQGDTDRKKSDWKSAIADYSNVLAIDPQSSVAHNARGDARQSNDDLDGAIKDYTQALSIDPQMAAAFNGRGNAKAGKADLEGAIADFTEALRIDPTMAVAYDSRGNAKTAKVDLDGAIADFTQAITIDPSLASAYSDRGFARQANGNLDGAISDYTQALALKPKTAVAYYNRGLARQSQGNLEAAIVDFDRALAFDPKIAGAYYNRGNAKNALHDLDGAIADYTQAVALNPKIALAYSSRGQARQAKGDLDGAINDYTSALGLDPKIALAYYNRGLIKEEQNDLDGAIADSSQALDLDPKNAQAYYNRGFAKLAKGNLDGAQADLKQFCDMATRDHYADHARLYLWLIDKAQNTKTDSDQELSDALENNWNSATDDVTSKTAAFLLGRINESDYLAAAPSPDAKTDQSQQCEAWYFAGMKRLLTGDKATAMGYFQKCLATNQKDHPEYILAQAEIQELNSAPPPVPAIPATATTPAAAPAPATPVPAKPAKTP